MRYIFNNFLNTLKRYNVSSLLNITGMAVAFAAFYVIMTQVCFNLGYNKSLKDADRTFVMSVPSRYNEGKFNIFINRPLGEALVSGSSMSEGGGVFGMYAYESGEVCYTRRNDVPVKMHLERMQYSAGGLRALNFEAVEGSLDELSKPSTIAISESSAKKYDLKLGDSISWSDPQGEKGAREIVSIYKDFPKNSDLGTVYAVYDLNDYCIDNRSEWSFDYCVKLQNASQKEEFEKESKTILLDYFKKLYDGAGETLSDEDIDEINNEFNIKLIPLSELFYTKELDGKPGRTGNLTTDMTLLAVAVLIILIALINFINFFFALVPARLRSVNTYKIFGVSRTSLIFNFIFESVGLVAIALALAAIIVILLLRTSIAGILGSSAVFGDNVPVLAMTVGAAVLTAVLGSIYPAFYITSFQPALVLKGSFSGSVSGRRLRTALIGFQFVISMSLIICAMFIKMQHTYLMNYDMGFNKSCLLSGHIPYDVCWYGSQNEAFEDKLRSNPQIQDITWADGEIVSRSRMGWGRDYKGKTIYFQCYPVAYNFLKFMGIDIVDGRDFMKSDEASECGVMIFNEQAKKDFDVDFVTPAPGHMDGTVTAGICKDFNFKPLQYGRDDFAFYVFGKNRWRNGLHQVYIRTTPGADVQSVIKFVLATVKEMVPYADDELYNIDFFDKELGAQYRQERRLSTLISIFTLVAIIISLMGVFGLVLFDTQHRSREIAVRRVMGGSVGDILKMFNAKYIRIVLASFVIAAPLSWWVINRYFAGFAYHTPVHWWVFALSLVIVLAITMLIVTLRSLDAATSNPVDSLKNE